MAMIRNLNRVTLEQDSRHSEVDATYSIVQGEDGRKLLQIDTYGSAFRKIPHKKSQSMRFAPEALEQLRRILSEEL
jgi:hypothetical protein